MDLKEKQLSASYVYQGKVIKVRVDQAKMPDGQAVQREVVEHPGGVGIALEDEDGKFFVVSQWRYAQKKVMLEFPAGKKEPGEDPLTTAKREIIEETGYSGKDFVCLGQMVPTGAYDEEVIDLYYAKCDQHPGQHLDSDEFMTVSRMTLEEMTEKCLSGEICDGKTMAMIFLIKERREREDNSVTED